MRIANDTVDASKCVSGNFKLQTCSLFFLETAPAGTRRQNIRTTSECFLRVIFNNALLQPKSLREPTHVIAMTIMARQAVMRSLTRGGKAGKMGDGTDGAMNRRTHGRSNGGFC
jgi:hypothetical protein